MAYSKTLWVDNSEPSINAEKLNKIEQGIEDAHALVASATEAAEAAPSLYTWVRYADNIEGLNISEDPTGKSFVGYAYNQALETPSEDPLDYTWIAMGVQGLPGTNGLGILSIARVSGNGAPGTIDTYRITYTDQSYMEYNVSNGADGSAVRGPTELFGAGTVWDDTLASEAFAIEGYTLLQFDRYTFLGDGTTGAITKYWTGAAWADYAEAIDGNLIVTGTIHGNKILANSITTAELNASSISLSGFVNDAGWTDDTVANSAYSTATSASSTASNAYSLASTAVQPGTIITTINNASTTISGNKITTGSITSAQLNANAIIGKKVQMDDAIETSDLTVDFTNEGWGVLPTSFSFKTDSNIGGLASVKTNSGDGAAIYGICTNSGQTGAAVVGVNRSTELNSWGGYFSGAQGITVGATHSDGAAGYFIGPGNGVYGVTSGVFTNDSRVGVKGRGYLGTSGTVGMFGIGDYAIVADDLGTYGFWTAGACYFEGTAYPFTGSHLVLSDDALEVGDIMIADEATGYSINNSIASASPTTVAKDKKVFGIYNGHSEDLLQFAKMSSIFNVVTRDEEGDPIKYEIKPEYVEYINNLAASNFKAVGVNALGEGMINVCNENGNIDKGDYICSSNVKGKGMKQDDDLLHNYTVAKALESVDWTQETSTTKMIACTYHCG